MTATGGAGFVGLSSDAAGAGSATTAVTDSDRDSSLRTGQLRVEIDGVEVPGFRIVDLPARYTSSSERAGNGEGTQRWGETTYDDLVMERGVAPGDTQLVDWRRAVEAGRIEDGSKELTVTILDEASQSRLRWTFTAAWPTAYDPPALDATGEGKSDVATETLTVAFRSVERVVEPVTEPKSQSGGGLNPLRTGLLRFVETANDGRISNGAVLATAAEAGIEQVTLETFGTGLTVGGDRVSVIVPEGIRGTDDGSATALWLASGADVVDPPASPSVPATGAGLYWVPVADFFPRPGWGSTGSARNGGDGTGQSLPGMRSDPENSRVLVVTGGVPFEDVFGAADGDAEGPEANVTPAENGEEIPLEKTVFAVAGNEIPPSDGGPLGVSGASVGGAETFFDVGGPAPLAGATFSLATLSTPDASVLGQSVNPLRSLGTAELLRQETARRVLRRAGLSDADSIEWLVGPREIRTDLEERTVNLLGNETPLESYEGVVSGRDGPWLVGIHVARVADDDLVVAAGVHRHPIGMPDGEITARVRWEETVSRAREFTMETSGLLEYL
ncbi:MAG: DUF6517 family protein [Haloferacaceae archaeon]